MNKHFPKYSKIALFLLLAGGTTYNVVYENSPHENSKSKAKRELASLSEIFKSRPGSFETVAENKRLQQEVMDNKTAIASLKKDVAVKTKLIDNNQRDYIKAKTLITNNAKIDIKTIDGFVKKVQIDNAILVDNHIITSDQLASLQGKIDKIVKAAKESSAQSISRTKTAEETAVFINRLSQRFYLALANVIGLKTKQIEMANVIVNMQNEIALLELDIFNQSISAQATEDCNSQKIVNLKAEVKHYKKLHAELSSITSKIPVATEAEIKLENENAALKSQIAEQSRKSKVIKEIKLTKKQKKKQKIEKNRLALVEKIESLATDVDNLDFENNALKSKKRKLTSYLKKALTRAEDSDGITTKKLDNIEAKLNKSSDAYDVLSDREENETYSESSIYGNSNLANFAMGQNPFVTANFQTRQGDQILDQQQFTRQFTPAQYSMFANQSQLNNRELEMQRWMALMGQQQTRQVYGSQFVDNRNRVLDLRDALNSGSYSNSLTFENVAFADNFRMPGSDATTLGNFNF